jgi:cell wall-associated NlpC family hydrolase
MKVNKKLNVLTIIAVLWGLIFILSSLPINLSANPLPVNGTAQMVQILSGEPEKPFLPTTETVASIPDNNANSSTVSTSSTTVNQLPVEPKVTSTTSSITPEVFLNGSLIQEIENAKPNGQTKIIKVKEYYRVKKGDTLYKIATSYKTSEKTLMRLNRLKSDLIVIGQKLFIGTRDKIVEIPYVDEEKIKAEVESFKEQLMKEEASQEDLSTIVGEKIAQTSLNYLGFPYKYGGESLWGMDCSAFVCRVFGFFGMEVPRTSREQFRFGERTSLDKLIPGDLVFFARGNNHKRVSHVGIYIGQNKFIHNSGADKKVVVSDLSSPYYRQRYKGACRVIDLFFPLLSSPLQTTQ